MSKHKRNRRASQGVLFVISALLIASGLIRLGDGTGRAVAREVAGLTQAPDIPSKSCESAPGVATLIAALRKREEQVTATEAAQKERQRSLDLAAQEVQTQIAALEHAEAQLRATVALADTAAESDLSRLTSVYENMKPKDAAPLFQEMAPEFAAGFLGRMRPDAAAKILAGMAPASAYSVSVILAGRNAGVPTE